MDNTEGVGIIDYARRRNVYKEHIKLRSERVTVGDLFLVQGLSKDFIFKTFTGSYWASADRMVQCSWARRLTHLSKREASWLEKILDDCVEKEFEKQETLR